MDHKARWQTFKVPWFRRCRPSRSERDTFGALKGYERKGMKPGKNLEFSRDGPLRQSTQRQTVRVAAENPHVLVAELKDSTSALVSATRFIHR